MGCAGKDVLVPTAILSQQEVDDWRQNHTKRAMCACFGSGSGSG